MSGVDGVLGSTAHRLRLALAEAQVENRSPSLVAGVLREGRLVWSEGCGDVPGEPADTQYKIGSITKTMTAVLVLQLVAEGRLSLDDTVGSVLGEVGYGDRTVRALLAHSAGLQSEPDGPWWERSENGPFDALAAANDGGRPAVGTEGSFHYSNLAYGLLGEVVARLHGQTWWDALRERVLVPLGMDRTSYQAEGVHADGWSVHPYERTLLREPHPDTGAMAPAGQLWSTITDLGTWTRFLLEGHPDVLGLAALEQAFVPRSGELASGLAYAHGLGFQMFAGGSGTLVGHTGSMPGFVATCFVDRPRRQGVVALSNATTGMRAAALAVRLLEVLESCEPTIPAPWRPVDTVPEELAGLTGVWHWGYTPFVFELENGRTGVELVARRAGVLLYRFAVRDGRIVGTHGHHRGEELRVVRREDGSIAHLDVRTFIFTRVPYDPESPVPGGVPG
ncbi:serine hydrolase domain-containing protein [Nocardioides pacificus]